MNVDLLVPRIYVSSWIISCLRVLIVFHRAPTTGVMMIKEKETGEGRKHLGEVRQIDLSFTQCTAAGRKDLLFVSRFVHVQVCVKHFYAIL